MTLTSSNGAVPGPAGSASSRARPTQRPVHDHLHVELPGHGDRPCQSTLSVNGSAPFTVATDNSGGNSGDATKIFQDANIQITPNGTNRVGASHTFTAHVNVNLGDGAGFAERARRHGHHLHHGRCQRRHLGAQPADQLRDRGWHRIVHDDDHLADDRHLDRDRPHHVHDPGGVVLTRNTDGTGANSGPAVKTWVNAKIAITPNATNEVGQPHTFTVTLRRTSVTARASCRPPVSTSTSP